MTIHKSFVTFILFLSLFLTGCNNSANNDERVIASEKTLPSDFYEIAFEREMAPFFQYMVRKAVNESEFDEMWALYRFEDDVPDVDFDQNAVFFIGVQESGSCPYEITSIELSGGNQTMTVPLSLKDPESDCTSDATQRTFVIEIDKETSTEIESFVIVESEVETDVPFEN